MTLLPLRLVDHLVTLLVNQPTNPLPGHLVEQFDDLCIVQFVRLVYLAKLYKDPSLKASLLLALARELVTITSL
jgi:hypothetical protein